MNIAVLPSFSTKTRWLSCSAFSEKSFFLLTGTSYRSASRRNRSGCIKTVASKRLHRGGALSWHTAAMGAKTVGRVASCIP